MDWEYVSSINLESLADDDKDQLYNMVTWFNIEGEDLDLEKCVTLIRISQETLKYKGEQVEVLLHKLDELATQKGEEEAITTGRRTESDNTDGRSSKSKKSSSMEFENLEEKYFDLKARYKKLTKTNEKRTAELNKLKQKIASLEQEKIHLLNEMQMMNQDDNQSEVSQSFREQHKDLLNTVHNKNKQISELLRDIEETERENMTLREKLTDVRDELAAATKELVRSNEIVQASKIELKEATETIKKLTAENDAVQEELQEVLEQKRNFEREMEEFTEEVNLRVDEWKRILDDKEKELRDLKSRQAQSSIHSSLSSLPLDKEQGRITTLNKLLHEREGQLLEVKTKLQESIAEMEKATRTIKELTAEKDTIQKNSEELALTCDDLKKKLRAAHERCHKLQEDLVQVEKLSEQKELDFKEFIDKFKDTDNIELSDYLDHIQKLQSKVYAQEKQIMELVKTTNKLQESCDGYERENETLRQMCGFSRDHEVIPSIPLKPKPRKRNSLVQQKQPGGHEEEIIELKTTIHKLNRTIGLLSQQIIDLGEKPKIDGGHSETPVKSEEPSKDEFAALVEENEALRRGMHEILDSVNIKKESSLKELKSETFEKLLRALDVKHVSGWYHPAMRLQAELHNMEGVNAELREQLRVVRLELQQKTAAEDNASKTPWKTFEDTSASSDIDSEDFGILNNIRNNLQQLVEKLESEFGNSDQIETKLISFKENFEQTRIQIGLLYHQYSSDTEILKDRLTNREKDLERSQELCEIQAQKLQLFEADLSEESATFKCLELSKDNVVLKRKLSYLENETQRLTSQIGKLQQNLAQTKTVHQGKIHKLTQLNQELYDRIAASTKQNDCVVDNKLHEETRKSFEDLTVKYRQLMQDFTQASQNKELEIRMLQQRHTDLEQHKNELKLKTQELFEKLHSFEDHNLLDVDNRIENLAKKLGQSEINEISEKQRANHINNLYELVKEQLQKSEERCSQFEQHNKDVIKKNLLLQDQIKTYEGQLCDYVTSESFQGLQVQLQRALVENEKLRFNLSQLEEKLQSSEGGITDITREWDTSRDSEILALKHQIVDLQATSDDKMQIARLSSELNHLRSQEVEYRNRIEQLEQQLKDCQTEVEDYRIQIETREMEASRIQEGLKNKIGSLRNILENHKSQYLGCIPLTSEEKFITNLRTVMHEKHQAFLESHNAQILVGDVSVLKDRYESELHNLENVLAQKSPNVDAIKELFGGLHDKKILELKYKRQSVLKDVQLQHVLDRLKSQDEHIIKLEEELFNVHKQYSISFDLDLEPVSIISHPSACEIIIEEKSVKTPDAVLMKLTKSKETQTIIETPPAQDSSKVSDEESQFASLHLKLLELSEEVSEKDQTIEQLKSKITEHEMDISLFRKQLGDKQSQITFYERHILELQSNKKEQQQHQQQQQQHTSQLVGAGDSVSLNGSTTEDFHALKSSISNLQESLKEKDDEILKYQSLLKEDRDKHSLAASLMRDELNMLQKCLQEERQKSSKLQSSLKESHPSKAALEQYFSQVHSLEDELSELRTKVLGLDSQLQASRQEAVRWRTLANDRLESMQKLGESLEELHQNEIQVYKNESDKWREEVNSLRQMIVKYRQESGTDFDLQKVMKDKDNRIHELTVMLRQAKSETRKVPEKPSIETLSRINELQTAKEQLLREHDAIKKRFDQLLVREKSAREEIRDLKGKLVKKRNIGFKIGRPHVMEQKKSAVSSQNSTDALKRESNELRNVGIPISSARSDKSERSIRDQLQKKIATLEEENAELKENLCKQTAINESHKLRIAEDFERWTKLKHWQQTAEKLKEKLKAKDKDLEKLQQTCAGYRILIERLERDKYGLENKIRTLKCGNLRVKTDEVETLRTENVRLISENEKLLSKLEMQQHHAGGLGAAMLQEKLEAQERKIAVLELSAKGTVEVRGELERLQNSLSSLQKRNLRLEAENLELKLDLEKSSQEAPHLREQIHHLENYIEVLKNESVEKDTPNHVVDPREGPKKISELERTIFVLKRVVEKLQAENKRLLSGRGRYPTSPIAEDKLQRDFQTLKEKNIENLKQIAHLEQELKTVTAELNEVRNQLAQKSDLLNKVKFFKEKSLLQKLAEMQGSEENGSEH